MSDPILYEHYCVPATGADEFSNRITQQLSQNIVPMTAYVTLNPDVTIVENNGVNCELALDTYSCR